ncbi:Ig domain-containing protein [Kinneretia asaccharophila]|uniref:Uncharacterized protein n=1 Tax=Roseateles asaccharophilus TaxID=582607 RepID=A0A4R6NDM7_9BURK|nr:Ig domain-containing protein [Roseateles asaccharophilus]MDN3543680.1 Ig domain-containing protein [Roseateles asaccharophilus]TDP11943.1 hypothetical protein DFR39_102329 [Roseateles asaccharophilus]
MSRTRRLRLALPLGLSLLLLAATSAPTELAPRPASAASAASAPNSAPAAPTSAAASAATPPGQVQDCGPLTRTSPPSEPPLPLSLAPPNQALPSARAGRSYKALLFAQGGSRPYVFGLSDGQLPPGIRMDRDGRLCGLPEREGRYAFSVLLTDANGRQASQSYVLRVLGVTDAKPAAGAASQALPAVPTVPGLVGVNPATTTVPEPADARTAIVYRLQAAQLDALLAADDNSGGDKSGSETGSSSTGTVDGATPPAAASSAPAPTASAPAAPTPPAASAGPTPERPAGLVWSEPQHKQLLQWLGPLLEREYPTRDLFLAAVDAQRCEHSRSLIKASAQQRGESEPPAEALARLCQPPPAGAAASAAKLGGPPKAPGRAATPTVKTSAPKPKALEPGQIPWEDLPDWLLPPVLREWLAQAARRTVSLTPAQPLNWQAVPGCDCLSERSQGLVYAVYPAWNAVGADPQTLDFSLLHRLSFMGLSFNAQGLDYRYLNPTGSGSAQRRDLLQESEFIRLAKHYGTQVDFMLYQRHWDFLLTEASAQREALLTQMLTQVPQQARELIDRPLPGLPARLKAALPLFGHTQHLGDGLSVFFDELPQGEGTRPELAGRIADFYPRFVRALAESLYRNPGRRYALNLVLTEAQLRAGQPATVDQLFRLMLEVEKPEVREGRIADSGGDYRSRTNVELRFMVLLPEPSRESKKRLRDLVERSPHLQGSNRRAMLRSIVPVRLLPGASEEQFRDDLVYFQDNFAGVGFWPAPLQGENFSDRDQRLVRTTLVGSPPNALSAAVCGWVCPNRWPLRLAFDVLLLVGLLVGVALTLHCGWRMRWGRYALLAGVAPFLLGAALLHCDPALRSLRDGNAQLILAIAIPVLLALRVLLRSRVEKP